MTKRGVGDELHVVPEPTPEERQAIARMLEGADTLPPAYRSAWRRSGTPGSEDDMSPEPGGEGHGDPTSAAL